jgi:hypothetical protein
MCCGALCVWGGGKWQFWCIPWRCRMKRSASSSLERSASNAQGPEAEALRRLRRFVLRTIPQTKTTMDIFRSSSILVGLVPMFLHAQPAIDWQVNLGGSNMDIGLRSVITSTGDHLVVGSSRSIDGQVTGQHGQLDIWVALVSSTGSLVWQRCIGGSAFDEGRDLLSTPDGGYLILGETRSNDGDVIASLGNRDMWVIKLSGAGNIEWERTFGGSGDEYAFSIQRMSDGSYMAFGATNSDEIPGYHGPLSDYYLVRIASNGDLIQQRCYGGALTEDGNDMTVTPEGLIVMCGSASSVDGDVVGNSGQHSIWILAVDDQMNIQWQRILQSNGASQALALCYGPSDQLHVTGYTNSTAGQIMQTWGDNDIWVIALDTLGNVITSASFGGSGRDAPRDIVAANNGDLFCVGLTGSIDGQVTQHQGAEDAWVLSLNASLELNWQRTFGGSNDDEFRSVVVDENGGLLAVGRSNSTDGDLTANLGNIDFWVVKLRSEEVGVPEHINRYRAHHLHHHRSHGVDNRPEGRPTPLRAL